MHRLSIKKDGKVTDHYFHHVTEKDGTKKHVYLGDDLKKADERLTKLRVARIRSGNRLINEMEKVQVKLNRLGAYDMPYDSKLSEVRQKLHKERHVDSIMGSHTSLPKGVLIVMLLVVLSGAAAMFVVSEPGLTGAAVSAVGDVTASDAFSTAFILLATVSAVALVLYAADYRHRHMHDKYRP